MSYEPENLVMAEQASQELFAEEATNSVPTDAEHTARAKAMMLDLNADEIIACIDYLAAKPDGWPSMYSMKLRLEERMGAFTCMAADATDMMELFNEVLAEEARELTYDEAKSICYALACTPWRSWDDQLADAFYERASDYLSGLPEVRAALRGTQQE